MESQSERTWSRQMVRERFFVNHSTNGDPYRPYPSDPASGADRLFEPTSGFWVSSVMYQELKKKNTSSTGWRSGMVFAFKFMESQIDQIIARYWKAGISLASVETTDRKTLSSLHRVGLGMQRKVKTVKLYMKNSRVIEGCQYLRF